MLGHGSPLRAALTGHDDDYKKKKRQPPRRVRSLTKKVARKRATKLLHWRIRFLTPLFSPTTRDSSGFFTIEKDNKIVCHA